jgi:hypothetical protein
MQFRVQAASPKQASQRILFRLECLAELGIAVGDMVKVTLLENVDHNQLEKVPCAT